MKISNGSRRRRSPRTDAEGRAQLLAAFDGSGLSAAAFARQQGLNYTTFCGWRQRRANTNPSSGFVQVELPSPGPPVELVIELNARARMRIRTAAQVELAARLLAALNPATAC